MNDEVFIKSNAEENLSPVEKITRRSSDLGTLKLIAVCLAKDFMRYSNRCSAGESPIYIKEINEAKKSQAGITPKPLSNYLTKNEKGLYSWKSNILDNNAKHIMLDIYVDNLKSIDYVKNSGTSIVVTTKEKAILNGATLEPGKTYIIKFQLLDRSSKGNEEYFMNKNTIEKVPNKEKNMLKDIKKFIEE